MQEHPRSSEIATVLTAHLPKAGAWEDTFYRMVTTKFANSADLLAGRGAQITGGRWTPQSSFRAIYGSLDPHTAMAEATGNYQDRGIPISRAMPLVVVGVNAKLQAVLDVTAAEFLNPLGLTTANLMQLDWRAEQLADREALTQAIGRLAYAAGLEAILVSSARAPLGKNIVVFPQRRRKGSSIKIENVRKLPKKKETP